MCQQVLQEAGATLEALVTVQRIGRRAQRTALASASLTVISGRRAVAEMTGVWSLVRVCAQVQLEDGATVVFLNHTPEGISLGETISGEPVGGTAGGRSHCAQMNCTSATDSRATLTSTPLLP